MGRCRNRCRKQRRGGRYKNRNNPELYQQRDDAVAGTEASSVPLRGGGEGERGQGQGQGVDNASPSTQVAAAAAGDDHASSAAQQAEPTSTSTESNATKRAVDDAAVASGATEEAADGGIGIGQHDADAVACAGHLRNTDSSEDDGINKNGGDVPCDNGRMVPLRPILADWRSKPKYLTWDEYNLVGYRDESDSDSDSDSEEGDDERNGGGGDDDDNVHRRGGPARAGSDDGDDDSSLSHELTSVRYELSPGF